MKLQPKKEPVFSEKEWAGIILGTAIFGICMAVFLLQHFWAIK